MVQALFGLVNGPKLPMATRDKTFMKLLQAFSAFKDDPVLEDPNASLSDNLLKLQEIGRQDSIIATDCKSLFDFEFRTLLQARLTKEHLATGVVASIQCPNCR